MSYQAQAQLFNNADFVQRCAAAAIQQAGYYKNDPQADLVALSDGLMRGNGTYQLTFVRLNAAGPGIADKVDDGEGGIDQSLVTDEDLLSLTQTNYPTVAALFFASDGTPLAGVMV